MNNRKNSNDAKRSKLMKLGIIITPEWNETNTGMYVQINRNGKIIKSKKIHLTKQAIDNALIKALNYEINKLD